MSQKHCFDLCGLHAVFGCHPPKKCFCVFFIKIRAVITAIRNTSIEIQKNISYNIFKNVKVRRCLLPENHLQIRLIELS